MKKYMYFFRIDIRLDSILRISGDGDDAYNLVTNGEGEYIIPSTGIAGAVKNYVNSAYPNECARLFGDRDNDSSVIYYDVICSNVNIEARKGICIDGRYGVAENKKLFTNYYIGQGMECELKIQCNVGKEDSAIIKDIIGDVAAAIESGRIRFGAKKTNGAGIFAVKNAVYTCLDMTNDDDRRNYIDHNILSLFEQCKDKLEVNSSSMDEWNSYILEARIPNGLIVKSGDREDGASVNMSREIDNKAEYYIPASTIKGIVRSYSEKIAGYLDISHDKVTDVFGNDTSEKDEINAGSVYADDCILRKAVTTKYNRIKVDRWLGSTISGAKAVDMVVSTEGNNTVSVRVSVDGSKYRSEDKEKLWKYANAFVYLTLRDIGLGKLPIGSGDAVGYGRLEGVNLIINGRKCPIDYEHKKVDASECESELIDFLRVLEV